MTENTLEGKVVLLTGAARRIGAATARRLHASGACVVVHYHQSRQAALALQAELNAVRPASCFLVTAGLADPAAPDHLVSTTLQQAGRLDVLVNNAAAFYPTPLESLTLAQWDELMSVNLRAPLFLVRAAMPELKQRQGSIVNLIDVHGMRPLPEHAVYGVSKAGLLMLTQVLARELGPAVRVNGVAPGAILWPEQPSTPDRQQDILERTALKRLGEPEDIARAILYLVRDAPYVTGQVLTVDGGRLLNY
ncbi:MAG: pteridine reductase [Thiothrix sp.]|nr:pteridine reductase [Thiothrix sp.]HPQ96658.1 pteridine reductase [Thiolinea sp.]